MMKSRVNLFVIFAFVGAITMLLIPYKANAAS